MSNKSTETDIEANRIKGSGVELERLRVIELRLRSELAETQRQIRAIVVRMLRLDPMRLSRREQEVLKMLKDRRCNKEIALALSISERTAKFHVSNILAKFGVNSRHDLY